MKKKYIIVNLIIVFIPLIDQLSKYLISKYIELGESIKIIDNFFYLTYHKNTGAAFGILENNIIILIIASLLILLFLISEIKKNINNKYLSIYYSVLIGGLIGNLIDRIFLRYVRDFIDFSFVNFAIFNISDMCITISVILILIYLFKENNNEVKSRK